MMNRHRLHVLWLSLVHYHIPFRLHLHTSICIPSALFLHDPLFPSLFYWQSSSRCSWISQGDLVSSFMLRSFCTHRAHQETWIWDSLSFGLYTSSRGAAPKLKENHAVIESPVPRSVAVHSYRPASWGRKLVRMRYGPRSVDPSGRRHMVSHRELDSTTHSRRSSPPTTRFSPSMMRVEILSGYWEVNEPIVHPHTHCRSIVWKISYVFIVLGFHINSLKLSTCTWLTFQCYILHVVLAFSSTATHRCTV